MSDNEQIVLEHEGSYVTAVESTGWDTVPVFFRFTKDPAKAKVFRRADVYPRKADKSLGLYFMGFTRGQAIPVRELRQRQKPQRQPQFKDLL